VSGPATSASGYGTYTIDATGHWSFALDNSNATVNALNNGGTLSDSFTVTTADGTSQLVNITINGHTDATDVLAPTDIVFSLDPASGGFSGNGLNAGDSLGSFTAVDADSASWTFALSGANASLFSLSPGGSQSNVTIAAASAIASGNYTFVVTATDGAGHSYNETYHVGVGTTGADNGFFTISTGTDVDFGLNGQDVINGGAGDDALVGGQNNDRITGGAGADQLMGGQGADTFVFAATSDSAPGHGDTIFDFEESVNSERIDLSAIDANLSSSGDQAFAFPLGQTSSVTNNSVTWYQDAAHNTTIVQADNNGDGVADLTITLLGLHSLTSSNFIL
jgi:VCBS repeat-containing protein